MAQVVKKVLLNPTVISALIAVAAAVVEAILTEADDTG